jgi:hypothetical protein
MLAERIQTYKNSFKEARKGAAGFPKFKAKKKHKDRYRTGMSVAVDLDHQTA